MLLLASITSASLPSVIVADKVILVDTAEANHNERKVKGNRPGLRVLGKGSKGGSKSSYSMEYGDSRYLLSEDTDDYPTRGLSSISMSYSPKGGKKRS